MYNNELFGPSSKVSRRFNDTPRKRIDGAAFQPHNDMPTAKDPFNYSVLDIPDNEKSTTYPSAINHTNITK